MSQNDEFGVYRTVSYDEYDIHISLLVIRYMEREIEALARTRSALSTPVRSKPFPRMSPSLSASELRRASSWKSGHVSTMHKSFSFIHSLQYDGRQQQAHG